MDGPPDTTAIARASRISKEPGSRPYRWGYFQAAVLIPWSLLLISVAFWDWRQPTHYPWYLTTIALLMGVFGLPLSYALLRRKVFGLALIDVMLGLVFLLAAVRLPTVIKHFTHTDQKVSGSFDAAFLLMWLLSAVYYHRRRSQFH